MPVKQKIPYDYGVFFITFTCFRWLHLFEITNSYDLVYKWFDVLKEKGHYIVGYEIMPNHLHAVIAFRKNGKSINTIIGNGKRMMAYEIVRRLNERNRNDILSLMESAVNKSDKSRSKLHEVWEDSFDWKYLYNDKLIIQKLDYMHWNPCVGKWKLVENPEDYIHGSAKFYILDEQGYYLVTSYTDLEDIDLSISLKFEKGGS